MLRKNKDIKKKLKIKPRKPISKLDNTDLKLKILHTFANPEEPFLFIFKYENISNMHKSAERR